METFLQNEVQEPAKKDVLILLQSSDFFLHRKSISECQVLKQQERYRGNRDIKRGGQ